ncbi:MAG: DNA cytosine methyltransferase [Nitrospira sp.]|nr:DNA cytosine methyltransferase [Nitrospira sp.]
MFVAENVKALLRHDEWLRQVLGDFYGLGYNLHYQLYQAADCRVPQTRTRPICRYGKVYALCSTSLGNAVRRRG